MQIVDKKCFWLFLIFFGWMQTVVVNAEGDSLCRSEFTLDYDEQARQAETCAKEAVKAFDDIPSEEKGDIDKLTRLAKKTIEAAEKYEQAVNLGQADEEVMDEVEEAVNDAKHKMRVLLSPFLNKTETCPRALALFRQLNNEIDEALCKDRPGTANREEALEGLW